VSLFIFSEYLQLITKQSIISICTSHNHKQHINDLRVVRVLSFVYLILDNRPYTFEVRVILSFDHLREDYSTDLRLYKRVLSKTSMSFISWNFFNWPYSKSFLEKYSSRILFYVRSVASPKASSSPFAICLFLKVTSGCLRLLLRLHVPSVFPSLACFRWQSARKM